MIVIDRGLLPYEPVWEEMKQLTRDRNDSSADECWILEHPPVYTQGQAGKAEHLLNPGGIPVVHSDRGGQVTYHGPGQLVAYLMLDINRINLGVRTLVTQLEQILITLLAGYEIIGTIRCGAPGVYVRDKKIASIGLRVKNGCSYHGLALNVNMDLLPFKGINPCGFTQLEMTQMRDFLPEITVSEVKKRLTELLMKQWTQLK